MEMFGFKKRRRDPHLMIFASAVMILILFTVGLSFIDFDLSGIGRDNLIIGIGLILLLIMFYYAFTIGGPQAAQQGGG